MEAEVQDARAEKEIVRLFIELMAGKKNYYRYRVVAVMGRGRVGSVLFWRRNDVDFLVCKDERVDTVADLCWKTQERRVCLVEMRAGYMRMAPTIATVLTCAHDPGCR